MEHMNKDHKVSLYDYLSYYGNINLDPLDSRTNVAMTSIDVDGFTLEYVDSKGYRGSKVIPIKPTMSSLRDARGVLVDMAKTSADARGCSVHQIDKYIGPSLTKIDELFGMGIVFYAIALAVKPQIALKTPVIGKYFIRRPQLPLAIIAVVHVFESFFLFQKLVRKYRIPQPARAKWIIENLLFGVVPMKRLRDEGRRLDNL